MTDYSTEFNSPKSPGFCSTLFTKELLDAFTQVYQVLYAILPNDLQ